MPDVELAAAADRTSSAAGERPRGHTVDEEMLASERWILSTCHAAGIAPGARAYGGARKFHDCQKPMAPGWADRVAMVEAAEAAGIPLISTRTGVWQPGIGGKNSISAATSDSDQLLVPHAPQRRRRTGAIQSTVHGQMPRLLIYETLVHHIDTPFPVRRPGGDLRASVARNPIMPAKTRPLLS